MGDSWKQQQPLEADNIVIDFFDEEDVFLGSQEMKRVMTLAKDEAADRKRKRKGREEYKSEGLAAEGDAAWSSAIQVADRKNTRRKSRDDKNEGLAAEGDPDAAAAAIEAAKKMKTKTREVENEGLAAEKDPDAAAAAIEAADKKKMKTKTRE